MHPDATPTVAVTTRAPHSMSLHCLQGSEIKAPHHLCSLWLSLPEITKLLLKIKHVLSLLSESVRVLCRTAYQTTWSIPVGNASITYGTALCGLLLLMDSSYLGVLSHWYIAAYNGRPHHVTSSTTQWLVFPSLEKKQQQQKKPQNLRDRVRLKVFLT